MLRGGACGLGRPARLNLIQNWENAPKSAATATTARHQGHNSRPALRTAMTATSDAPPLYGRMMSAIRTGHTFGNRVRFLKLPLIFLDPALYADAIAQFYWLSEALEDSLRRHASHPLVRRVAAIGLEVTPGYASDLEALHGEGWRAAAQSARTRATLAYVSVLYGAEPVQLVAAAFILYGALVVGGGKSTQAKVRRIFPECEHRLFDVSDDMPALRARFKAAFTAIGEEWPEHREALEAGAAKFMGLNNTVVLSCRCLSPRVVGVAARYAAVGVAAAAVVAQGVRSWRRA